MDATERRRLDALATEANSQRRRLVALGLLGDRLADPGRRATGAQPRP